MEDLRLTKIELAVHNHNRRLDDHDRLHAESKKDIDMLHDLLIETRKQTGVLLDLAPSIKSLEEYASKTYDVIKPLTTISGYVIKIGALALVIWHGIKWAAAKLVLWS